MKKSSLIVLCTLLTTVIVPLQAKNVAKAENVTNFMSEEAVEPRGIFTNLSLYLDGGDGTASAIVKNQFTLLPAQVQVYVELYYSNTYQESYENMELAVRKYISDLNMGEKIYATASTNGETRYWMARMRYRLDNNEWQSKTTSTLLLDGNGDLIG